jgi:thioester reductase-like protein
VARTYFVTGATGFIGRHLVERLLEQREGDIHVLVRKDSAGKLEALSSAGRPRCRRGLRA